MAPNAHGPQRGRPPRLCTPSARDALFVAVRNGTPFKFAATAAGISYGTFLRWARNGRRDQKAGKQTVYAQFWIDLIAAEGEGVSARMAIIMQAAKKDWRAAQAVNLSRHPEHFDVNRNELRALRKEVQELQRLLSQSLPAEAARGNQLPGEPSAAPASSPNEG